MPMIHARHRLGFKIVFDDVDRERLDEAVDWLVQHGYKPDPPTGDQWQRTPDGLPICGKHNAVMAKREKQSDIWFSHKIIDQQTGEILYCRGYPNSTSTVDGYDA